MACHRAEPLHQLPANIKQCLCVLGQHILLPGKGNGFHHRPDRDGGGQGDSFAKRPLHQVAIDFERR